ncbi:MAG: hypothetical protein ACFFCS_22645 [Candidatus Hodarchaeota archaeon]
MINPFAAFGGGGKRTSGKKKNTHIRMAIFFTGLIFLVIIPPIIHNQLGIEEPSYGWYFTLPIDWLTQSIIETLIIGVIILGNTVLAIIYGVKAKNNPEEEEEESYGLPKDLKRIKGVLQLYPSLTRKELAEKAEIEPSELEEKLVEFALSGQCNCQIDPGSGRIMSKSVNLGIVTDGDSKPDILKCPYCFAPLKSSPVRGTSMKCESCGKLIVS